MGKNRDLKFERRWDRIQEKKQTRNRDSYSALASENAKIDLQLEKFLNEENERLRKQSEAEVMGMEVLKSLLLAKKIKKGARRTIVVIP